VGRGYWTGVRETVHIYDTNTSAVTSSLNAPLEIPFRSLGFAGDPRRRKASTGTATHNRAPLPYGNASVQCVALFLFMHQFQISANLADAFRIFSHFFQTN